MKDVQSEDPFNIYELLEKKQRNVKDDAHSEETLKFPPGFTPRMDTEINSNDLDKESEEENKDVQRNNKDEVESVVRNVRSGSMLKEDVETSTCTGKFKKVAIPRAGVSILQLMDDLVKVGQTMGYKMDGCIRNIEEIIESRGENEINR